MGQEHPSIKRIGFQEQKARQAPKTARAVSPSRYEKY